MQVNGAGSSCAQQQAQIEAQRRAQEAEARRRAEEAARKRAEEARKAAMARQAREAQKAQQGKKAENDARTAASSAGSVSKILANDSVGIIASAVRKGSGTDEVASMLKTNDTASGLVRGASSVPGAAKDGAAVFNTLAANVVERARAENRTADSAKTDKADKHVSQEKKPEEKNGDVLGAAKDAASTTASVADKSQQVDKGLQTAVSAVKNGRKGAGEAGDAVTEASRAAEEVRNAGRLMDSANADEIESLLESRLKGGHTLNKVFGAAGNGFDALSVASDANDLMTGKIDSASKAFSAAGDVVSLISDGADVTVKIADTAAKHASAGAGTAVESASGSTGTAVTGTEALAAGSEAAAAGSSAAAVSNEAVAAGEAVSAGTEAAAAGGKLAGVAGVASKAAGPLGVIGGALGVATGVSELVEANDKASDPKASAADKKKADDLRFDGVCDVISGAASVVGGIAACTGVGAPVAAVAFGIAGAASLAKIGHDVLS